MALCALTGISVVAQQSVPFAQALAQKPDKAVVDKPVADFKLTDLMHEKKDGEKPDAQSGRPFRLQGQKARCPVLHERAVQRDLAL